MDSINIATYKATEPSILHEASYLETSNTASNNEPIINTDWYIYAQSGIIKFYSISSENSFKTYYTLNPTYKLFDRKNGDHIFQVTTNKKIIILLRNLSIASPLLASVLVAGSRTFISQPEVSIGLQDGVHAAVGLENKIEIYQILGSFSLDKSYLLGGNTHSIAALSNSTLIAAVDNGELYVFDWRNNLIKEWSKILSENSQKVANHPYSNDYFLVGFSGVADTGGIMSYDRLENSEIFKVVGGFGSCSSLSVSNTGEFVSAGGISGEWAIIKNSTCHSDCSTCDGPTQVSCTGCHPSYHLNKASIGGCMECNLDSNYLDTSSEPFQCQSCDDSCLGCTGPSPEECINCKEGYFMQSSTCKYICEAQQYWILSNQCLDCPLECVAGCKDLSGECKETSAPFPANTDSETSFYSSSFITGSNLVFSDYTIDYNKTIFIEFKQFLSNNPKKINLQVSAVLEDKIVSNGLNFNTPEVFSFKILDSESNESSNSSNKKSQEREQIINSFLWKSMDGRLVVEIEISGIPKLKELKLNSMFNSKSGLNYNQEDGYLFLFYKPTVSIVSQSPNEDWASSILLGKILELVTNYGEYFAAGIALLPLGQSSNLIRFTQSVKLLGLLRFININMGKKAEDFMDNISGYSESSIDHLKQLKKEAIQVSKSTRGKLTKKRVKFFSSSKEYLKLSLYLVSSIINMISQLILLKMKKRKEIILTFAYLIYYHRRIHFILFNMVILNLYFIGLRTIVHSQFKNLDFKQSIQYLITFGSLLCSLIDFYSIKSVTSRLRRPILSKIGQIQVIEEKIIVNKRINNTPTNSPKNIIATTKFFSPKVKSNRLKLSAVLPIENKKKKIITKITKKLNVRLSLIELQKNKAIQQYLLERFTIKNKNSIRTGLNGWIGSLFIWRIILFSVIILSLQYLSVACISALILIEVTMILSSILSFIILDEIISRILVLSRVISTFLVLLFLVICLRIGILNEAPNDTYQTILMITYLGVIIVEILDMLIVNVLMFIDLSLKLYKFLMKIKTMNLEYTLFYFTTTKFIQVQYQRIKRRTPVSKSKRISIFSKNGKGIAGKKMQLNLKKTKFSKHAKKVMKEVYGIKNPK